MAVIAKDVAPRFSYSLVEDESALRESQRLRYRIFAEEMGAQIDGGPEGLDQDEFDPYCEHLVVRNEDEEIVASTRLLSCAAAARIGDFYSAHEFTLDPIHALQGRKLEIGRTCVHADYRSGTTIAVLWSGLAEYVAAHDVDYLFGCASIPMDEGMDDAYRIMQMIRERYMSAPDLRVEPLLPLPPRDVAFSRTRMPPLLKAYVSLGARACGEPFWDQDFNCADVFVLLNLRELHPRYVKRFLGPVLAR